MAVIGLSKPRYITGTKNLGPNLANVVSHKRLPKGVGITLEQHCLVEISLKQRWKTLEQCSWE